MAQSLDPDRSGIALDTRLFAACMLQRPAIGWVELELDALAASPPAGRAAAALGAAWPVALRAARIALGAAGGLPAQTLDAAASLAAGLKPARVTVALAWPDPLFPNPALQLAYDDAALLRVGADVARLQDRLGRSVLIENPPGRLRGPFASDEAAFLAALVARTGCGLAVDLANLEVSCANRGGEPLRWLAALPARAVGLLRLAGHGMTAFAADSVLVADRRTAPPASVWALYAAAVRRFPGAATLVAWDTTQLGALAAEAARADRRRRAALDAGGAWGAADDLAELGSGGFVSRSPALVEPRPVGFFSPGEPDRRPAPDRTARVGGAAAAAETRLHA